MFKTEIWIVFRQGGFRELIFSKTFNLPFCPFVGLILIDSEENIKLANNDYCSTNIYYDVQKNSFLVEMRHSWRYGVADETIDDTLKSFISRGWERKDTTDIEKWKEYNCKKQGD